MQDSPELHYMGRNFLLFSPFFFSCLKEKIRGTTAIILYMRDTIDEEGVLRISVECKTYMEATVNVFLCLHSLKETLKGLE